MASTAPHSRSRVSTASIFLAAAPLLLSNVAHAHAHHPALLLPRPTPLATYTPHLEARGLATMTYQGCYSASDGLTDQGAYMYQTTGYCQPICVNQNQAVLGLSAGSDCWCGDTLPPASSKVDDSKCDTPCNGFGTVMCGGTGFYSIYLSGTTASAANYGDSSSSSSDSSSDSSSSSTTPPPASSAATTATTPTTTPLSIVTSVAPDHTIIVTASAPQQATSTSTAPVEQQKAHSPNVAGIAAGVVVGVLALLAIAAGIFFFLRHKRRRQAEDEYKRSTQVNEFMRAGKNDGFGRLGTGQSDARLDPEAGGARRDSAGSLVGGDGDDYSRRILRVANPSTD